MNLPDDQVVALVESAEQSGHACELLAAFVALPEVVEARRRVDALRVVDRLVAEGMSVRSAVAFLTRSKGYPVPPSRLRRWHAERAKSLRGPLFTPQPARSLEEA